MRDDMRPSPFPRILAPVDGSPASEVAVLRSEHLMTLPGASVTLFFVEPPDGTRSRECRSRIETLENDLQSRGIDVVTRVRAGNPATEILREIDSGRHDLVVMKSRRRPVTVRAVLGSVALDVLRRSTIPLLLFRPLAGLDESFFAVERSEPAAFRRILVMLDGSKEAERILGPAEKVAAAFDSELVLFQALGGSDPGEERVDAARTYLATHADALGARGIAARLLIVPGDPVEGALVELEGGVDSVALTTRGRSFWESEFLGSVASRLLRSAEGPTLCLSSRPAGPAREPRDEIRERRGTPALDRTAAQA